jgi:hypothetical protein
VLDHTADDLGPTGRDVQFGYGLLDAAEASEVANGDKSLSEVGCS